MKDTIQITIAAGDEREREQLIAQLSDIDFDGFEEKETELVAYIDPDHLNTNDLHDVLSQHNLSYTQSIIPGRNWNEVWESNFPPVVIGNFCAIRAEFHPPFTDKQHEIVITPKMSFGTGHHATTFMMVQEMSTLNFKNKEVADFGTGTGILSILAEKLGSKRVWAIDNDDWSIENAGENLRKNGCQKVILEKKEAFDTLEQFDIILANINKNVIQANQRGLVDAAKPTTSILLSGLLKEDEAEVASSFKVLGFRHERTIEKNNWICMLLQYELKSE